MEEVNVIARKDKILYYLGIAEAVAARGSCLKKRYGAVIVKDDTVIATGYVGSPRGCVNCTDIGMCPRLKVQRGTAYDTCVSVHAEMNCIISASREEMLYSTMYIYGYDLLAKRIVEHPSSCPICKRLIINAGIEEVVFADVDGIKVEGSDVPYGYTVVKVADWVSDRNLISTVGY